MHRLPRMSPINWVRLALIPAGGDWRDLPASVSLPPRSGRQNGGFGVEAWKRPSHAVLAEGSVRNTRASVVDPRVTCKRREGSMGVLGWGHASTSHASPHNHPSRVADPRLGDTPRGVRGWAQPSHKVVAAAATKTNVPGPRVPSIAGPGLDLASTAPTYIVICAADGTWHRPMTTLELAALQGFPLRVDGDWLKLDGRAHKGWRQRIGNAVPPPAAEAIAREAAAALTASADKRLRLSGRPVWLSPNALAAGGGRQGRLDLGASSGGPA